MNGFAQRLARGPALLLDGGMGTLLMARGLARGDPPETWNAERPDEVTAAHRAYLDAGADAVHTNTFGGHPSRLGAFGLAGRCEALNRAAVDRARESGARFVIGDLGPTGEHLPPVGRGDLETWRAGFERQAAVLAEAGADALHVETMTDLREALVALEATRRAAPGLAVLVSMSFERKRRGFFTVMGDPLVGSLSRLSEAGADAVGSNCSQASADMRSLADLARTALDARFVFQPNAGAPECTDGGVRYALPPEQFAEDMAAVAHAGAAAVGGCCGTDPRFVAALRDRLRSPRT